MLGHMDTLAVASVGQAAFSFDERPLPAPLSFPDGHVAPTVRLPNADGLRAAEGFCVLHQEIMGEVWCDAEVLERNERIGRTPWGLCLSCYTEE